MSYLRLPLNLQWVSNGHLWIEWHINYCLGDDNVHLLTFVSHFGFTLNFHYGYTMWLRSALDSLCELWTVCVCVCEREQMSYGLCACSEFRAAEKSKMENGDSCALEWKSKANEANRILMQRNTKETCMETKVKQYGPRDLLRFNCAAHVIRVKHEQTKKKMWK